MIETCKNCRHCDRKINTIGVWDKYGLHIEHHITYWCKKFYTETPPINRCEHINDPVKTVYKPEVLEIE